MELPRFGRSVGALLLALSIVSAASSPSATAAGETDPHRLYEDRCGGCHFEHAGDLARLKLKLDGTVLSVARTGTPVTRLLRSHHKARLDADELALLLEAFASGIKWGGVFQHRCGGCHERAAVFARARLELKDDRIIARSNGADVAELLDRHGDATPAEIATLLEMLRFQLRAPPPVPANR